MKSKFGKNFTVTISGGSHEPEMTAELVGLPTGFEIDIKKLQQFISRRSSGQTPFDTPRKEADIPLLRTDNGDIQCSKVIVPNSGKLVFTVKNKTHNSAEYSNMPPRPGHADLPAQLKYKGSINMAGGGPFSGRMTVMLCIAGGIAMQILNAYGIKIASRVLSIGSAKAGALDSVSPQTSPVSELMLREIKTASEDENSVGGVVEAFATNIPSGLGGPMYNGTESVLSPIVFGIPAVKGVEFGNGFAASYLTGSENNDDFLAITDKEKIITATNNHGGILGGLTTGMPLIMRVAFKPTPSIGKKQQSVDLKSGKPIDIKISGRHDACIVPRAAVAVEAALAAGILDIFLGDERYSKDICTVDQIQNNQLTNIRKEIDAIDDEIISLLQMRENLSKHVAYYKSEKNISIKDNGREQAILAKTGNLKDIYEKILEHSRNIQKAIIKGNMKGD